MIRARLGLACAAATGVWLVLGGSAFAADHVVDCAAHPSSMAAAIQHASAGDRLLVNGRCLGTYTIDRSLTIRGNPRATFDGQASGDSIFLIDQFVRVRFVRVTIENGQTIAGGAIFSENPSTVVLDHSTVRRNHADEGGGLVIGGRLRMRSSAVIGNTSLLLGGGLTAGGIQTGTISTPRPVTIVNSTISGNHTKGDAAGLFFDGNPFSIRGTTISNNSTGPQGTVGGIDVLPLPLDQQVPGVISGSIIAANTAPENADCNIFSGKPAAAISGGWNVVGPSCNFSKPGDVKVSPAMLGLGPLGWNGGSTKTMPLLPASPAIDRIPIGTKTLGGSSLCPQVDQRGVIRPQGPACDSGAYELIR